MEEELILLLNTLIRKRYLDATAWNEVLKIFGLAKVPS
jgi:hypothetical protein